MTSLLDVVLEHDDLADLDPAQRRLALRAVLSDHVDTAELACAVADVADVIDGYGALTPLMRDEGVTDVLVNGTDGVWIEQHGRLQQTNVVLSEQELSDLIDRLLTRCGGRADLSHPIADARLPDGSRLHVVLPPIAPEGPLVSIRRFPARPLDIAHLVGDGMLTGQEATFLTDAVAGRMTIAISGATGTGKTTLLNALLNHVGDDERVVVIEETRELTPQSSHLVSLVARGPNSEGSGAVTTHDLVRAALRMRPNRIVIGEVRGAECLSALAAMSTGHEGSLVTVHARSATNALERLTTLALEAGSGASQEAIAARVHMTFDVVVHLERRGRKRRVAEVADLRGES